MALISEKKWIAPLLDLISGLSPKQGRRLVKKSLLSFNRRFFTFFALIIVLALATLTLFGDNNSSKENAAAEQGETPPAVSNVKPQTVNVVKKASLSPTVQMPLIQRNQAGTVDKQRVDFSLARQKYSQAMQAFTNGHHKKAIVLFDEVVRLNPAHPSAASKGEEARKQLKDMIQQYYNIGLRNFANLYYERALQEWEKVAALSADFDPEYYTKATNKIAEAKQQILESR